MLRNVHVIIVTTVFWGRSQMSCWCSSACWEGRYERAASWGTKPWTFWTLNKLSAIWVPSQKKVLMMTLIDFVSWFEISVEFCGLCFITSEMDLNHLCWVMKFLVIHRRQVKQFEAIWTILILTTRVQIVSPSYQNDSTLCPVNFLKVGHGHLGQRRAASVIACAHYEEDQQRTSNPDPKWSKVRLWGTYGPWMALDGNPTNMANLPIWRSRELEKWWRKQNRSNRMDHGWYVSESEYGSLHSTLRLFHSTSDETCWAFAIARQMIGSKIQRLHFGERSYSASSNKSSKLCFPSTITFSPSIYIHFFPSIRTNWLQPASSVVPAAIFSSAKFAAATLEASAAAAMLREASRSRRCSGWWRIKAAKTSSRWTQPV